MKVLILMVVMVNLWAKDEVKTESCTVRAEVLAYQKSDTLAKLKIKVKKVIFKTPSEKSPQCHEKEGKTLDLTLNYLVGKPELGKVYPFSYSHTEETTDQGSKTSESWRLDIK